MAIKLDIQIACDNADIPTAEFMQAVVENVLARYQKPFELTIRIVSEQESSELNGQYRNKPYATNVLSFPFEAPKDLDLDLLGDLVICADIVSQEAQHQNKTVQAHWAHMITHGCLHLLGYDHINDDEAEEMEALETKLLAQLGFDDPYLTA